MREKIIRVKEYLKRYKWNVLILFISFFLGFLLLNLIPNLYFQFSNSQSRLTFLLLGAFIIVFCFGGSALNIFMRLHKSKKLFCLCILRCLFLTCIIVGIILTFSTLTYELRKSYIFGEDSLVVKVIPEVTQYALFPLIAITYLQALAEMKISFLAYLKKWFMYLGRTILWLLITMCIFWGIDEIIHICSNESVVVAAETINVTLLWVLSTEIFLYRNFEVVRECNHDKDNV